MTLASGQLASRLRRLARKAAFAFLVLLFLIIVLWEHVVVTVPAGHVGVIWWRFFGGTSLASPGLGSGTRLIFPWDKLYVYDARMQENSQEYSVITKEGLSVKVTVSFRWVVIPNSLGLLHESVGPEYLSKLLVPEIGSYLRRELSQFTAEEIFTTRRTGAQEDIYSAVVDRDVSNGIGNRDSEHEPDELIALIDILMREIVLPDKVRTAIEHKLEQAQVVEEYRFRVARERLESERKAIEADGIRRFQDIVATTISDAYLRWRGVEATLKLAESNNAKVVIIGNGPGGLPVILNGFDGKTEPATKPDVSPGSR